MFLSQRRLPVVILVDPVSSEEHIWSATTGDELEVKQLKLYYTDPEDITGVAHLVVDGQERAHYIRVVETFDERVQPPRRYNELRNRIFKEVHTE